MRKFSALVALIATFFIMTVSCQQAPFITISGSRSLSFSKDGCTQSISFSVNRDWSIVSSESWCKAASASGKAGTGAVTVSITCEPNQNYDARSCTLTIRVDELSETITVSQDSKLGLIVDTKTVELTNAAQSFEIKLQKNVPYTVMIDDAGAGWITYTGTKALVSEVAAFSVTANDDYDSREGRITFKQADGTVGETVIVRQGEANGLFITKPEYDLSNQACTLNIEVKANVEFEVTSQADWITYVETKALNSSTITLSIEANDSYDSRVGTVKVKQTNGNLTGTVTIRQGQTNGLFITTPEYELSNEEHTLSVEVKANVEFEVTSQADWITYVETKSLHTSTITLQIAANDSYDQRMGTVKVKQTNGDLSGTITITQKQSDGLVVTPSSFDLSNEAQNVELTVDHNVPVSVIIPEEAKSWISQVTSSPSTKAMETSKITLSVAKNTTYDARLATITIKETEGALAETVTIHQGETNGLFITTPEYELSNEEHTLSVEVKANVEFEVTSQADWITYVETKSLHTSTITLQIAANDSYDQRMGTVKVKQTNGDLSGTITITQKQSDGLVVTPSSFDLSNEAQNVELTVDHNVPVSVIIPEEAKSWISQVTSSPSTKAMETSKITLSIAKNSIFETREASITIKQSAGNLAETVEIKQQSAPAVFADKAFEAFLIGQFDKDGNGYITKDEALDVTSIVVESDDIENMSGIEVFENLVELSAVPKHTSSYGVGIGEDWRNTGYTFDEYNGYNTVAIVVGKLASLDVSKNTKLTKLDCSGNVLTSVDLSSNANLEVVNLSCNYDLNNVSLGDCSSLRELNLQATSVSLIDLSECPNLEVLHFDRGLEVESGTIDVSHNLKLRELWIDYRGFTHIDVTNNSELTQLSCAMNRLTALDVSKNPKLFFLHFGFNQIESIDLSANPEIESLMFQNNNIKNISLSNLTHLQAINLGNYVSGGGVAINTISEVDLSHNSELRDLFTSISDIKTLDVSDKTKLLLFDCCYNNLVEEIDISNSPNFRNLFCYEAPSLTKIYINSEQRFTYSKDNTAHFYYRGGNAPYTSSDYSQDGIVTTMQSASEGNGVNIVLMGDAFSDRLIADGTYETVMSEAMEAFFSIEPYKSFRNRFNVYSVTAVSPNETYDGTHETAFSTRFGNGTAIYGDDGTVFNYATKVPGFDPDNGLICVVLNEKVYAGTCSMYANYTVDGEGNVVRIDKDASGAAIAYIPLGTDSEMFSQLVHHEAGGHGFAKLADEYFYSGSGAITKAASDELSVSHGAGWYTNVDTASDVESVLWTPFIQDTRYASEKIGLYEGAYLYESGVYRPTDDGVMNTNQGQFNAPSRMAIYNRINKLANGEAWMLNYEDFVSYDAINLTPSMNARKPNGQDKRTFVPLQEPVVHKGSWRDVTPNPKRLTGEPSVKSSHLREMSARRQKRTQVSGAVSPNYATHDGTYMDGSVSKK